MFKKWLGAISAITVSGLYWLSFEREEYVRKVVHSECNAAIKGFFNKTATSTGWNCSQNGEVIHTVGFKASMIPSPLEITGVLLAAFSLAIWVLVLWYLIIPSMEVDDEYES